MNNNRYFCLRLYGIQNFGHKQIWHKFDTKPPPKLQFNILWYIRILTDFQELKIYEAFGEAAPQAQYIYQDSWLIVPVVYFVEPV